MGIQDRRVYVPISDETRRLLREICESHGVQHETTVTRMALAEGLRMMATPSGTSPVRLPVVGY